jgi:hypothetical protein
MEGSPTTTTDQSEQIRATSGACPGYVRDHIVPICAGGADATWNMQWQTTADGKTKDVTERRACGRQR